MMVNEDAHFGGFTVVWWNILSASNASETKKAMAIDDGTISY